MKSVLVIAYLVACAPFVVSAPAQDGPDTSRWNFLPEVGIDGMASIRGDNFTQMGIECGNGGGPVISLGPVPRQSSGADRQSVDLDFDWTCPGKVEGLSGSVRRNRRTRWANASDGHSLKSSSRKPCG